MLDETVISPLHSLCLMKSMLLSITQISVKWPRSFAEKQVYKQSLSHWKKSSTATRMLWSVFVLMWVNVFLFLVSESDAFFFHFLSLLILAGRVSHQQNAFTWSNWLSAAPTWRVATLKKNILHQQFYPWFYQIIFRVVWVVSKFLFTFMFSVIGSSSLFSCVLTYAQINEIWMQFQNFCPSRFRNWISSVGSFFLLNF